MILISIPTWRQWLQKVFILAKVIHCLIRDEHAHHWHSPSGHSAMDLSTKNLTRQGLDQLTSDSSTQPGATMIYLQAQITANHSVSSAGSNAHALAYHPADTHACSVQATHACSVQCCACHLRMVTKMICTFSDLVLFRTNSCVQKKKKTNGVGQRLNQQVWLQGAYTHDSITTLVLWLDLTQD